jgi:hypothetical protein
MTSRRHRDFRAKWIPVLLENDLANDQRLRDFDGLAENREGVVAEQSPGKDAACEAEQAADIPIAGAVGRDGGGSLVIGRHGMFLCLKADAWIGRWRQCSAAEWATLFKYRRASCNPVVEKTSI